MLLRTPWESREQSRVTGLDNTGEAAGRDGMGDFMGEADMGSPGKGHRAPKEELGTTRNGDENRLMPHCATVASHSRPSTRK